MKNTKVEILEDKPYEKYHPLTIEMIRDNDQTNEQSRPVTSREDEEYLYVKSQYKGTSTTCRKYGHKGKYFGHKEGANLPKFHY